MLKTRNLRKAITIVLVLLLVFAMNAVAFAQVTQFIAKDADDNYYAYDYQELVVSYTSFILGGEGAEGAELYEHFAATEGTAMLFDQDMGYIDFQDVLDAYTAAFLAGEPFSMDDYIASGEAAPADVTGKTIIEVTVDGDGNIVETPTVPVPDVLDIVDTANADDDFETLVAAIEAADLVDDLKAEGPFTVFAPTDEAFANLLADLEFEVEDLLALENLADILLYHVVDGAVFSSDLVDGQEVETLQGQTVTITIDNEDVFVNDAKVVIADIECSNGVIHAIDAVLLPDPELEVTEVSAITTTDVTVTFEELEDDLNDANVEVINPDDEAVATEAKDLAAGATEATFDFVDPLDMVMPGIWTVNGVEFEVEDLGVVRDVSDADELYDALVDQCDYDAIRLVDDIDGVDFDVRLFCDGLLFYLNGYTLTLDEDYDFKVEGDDIQVWGSELVLQEDGEFLVEGDNLYIEGLNLVTDDEDFDVDTGGSVKLTIVDSNFDLGDGDFDVYANYEGAEVDLSFIGFELAANRFYVDAYDDEQVIKVDIASSEFDLEDDFYLEIDTDEGVIELTITDSDFTVGGDFDLNYFNGDETEVTVNIDNSTFDISGDFELGPDDDDQVVNVTITESDFVIGSEFIIDVDGDNTVVTINISGSSIEADDGFYINADGDDQVVNIDITDSEFTLPDYYFEIEAGDDGTDATVNIINCEFYDVYYLNIDADGAYLENLTFGAVDYSLDEIRLRKDTTINGLTFEEGIEDFDFSFYDSAVTVTLLNDIVLEHEDNEIVLYAWDNESQLRGNGNAITGEGKASTRNADNMVIFDLVFEVPFEINNDIVLVDVILAETTVDSDFTVSRTVTMTEDMTLATDVTIYADRAPLPLAEGVTIRGTLVGEGDVKIDGSVNDLEFEDKLKVKNVTLEDLDYLEIAHNATVVFEDVTLGDMDNLWIGDDATLLFASDITTTENLRVEFSDTDGVLDGGEYSLLADDEETIRFYDGAGTVKDLTFELEVTADDSGLTFEEVMFMEDVAVNEDALMIGGGWDEEAVLYLADAELTFEAGESAVNNAGLIEVVHPDAEILFDEDMATDLANAVGVTDVDFSDVLASNASDLPFDLTFTLEGMNVADGVSVEVNMGQRLELEDTVGNWEVHQDGEEVDSDVAEVTAVQAGTIGAADATITITAGSDGMEPGEFQILHDVADENEGIATTENVSATVDATVTVITLETEFSYELAPGAAVDVAISGSATIGSTDFEEYTAVVEDADGAYVGGVPVTFTVTSAQDPGLTRVLSQQTVTVLTDASGEAEYTLSLDNAITGHVYNIEASIDEADENVEESDSDDIDVTVN